jgi:hypothetical protein
MGATERQDDLLLAIVNADDRMDGLFFTASSQTSTTLFHPGFPANNQIEIAGMGSIEGLAQRGFVRITERRQHGDVAFALTPAGREEVQRRASGGKSALEAAIARAEAAETALATERQSSADRDDARATLRAKRAGYVAWAIAIVVAVWLGSVLVDAAGSTNKTMAAITGVLLAAGVTG